MKYIMVITKRSLLERIRYRIAAWLIDKAYDLHDEAFIDFCADNGWDYCEDCQGRGY
jgi:hypothetical protein